MIDSVMNNHAGYGWERRVRKAALQSGIGACFIAAALFYLFLQGSVTRWPSMLLAVGIGWFVYYGLMAKVRRRRRILAQPFPKQWLAVLNRDVLFYNALGVDDQVRFRRELQIFLGEKRITGIKTKLDATTHVLAGASAIIPIFGFPEWEWDQISEVLIYPNRFDEEYGTGDRSGQHILGMVGTGAMNRVMILSKPDLIQGFRNPGDKRNVGIHEFAHLVDKSDGTIDGLPGVGLDRHSIGPWIELVRRKMKEIEDGDSDIDRYALTNKSEFFSVATEYFFERPGIMERKHPQLYKMMTRIFKQDLRSRIKALAEGLHLNKKKLGRNSPCPCGSGIKYKKCCLRGQV
jgi:Mlc titration factor MtfA (ptsG expression regulator)